MEQYIATWQGDLGGLKERVDKHSSSTLNKKCKVEKGDKAKYHHLSGKAMLYLACQKGHNNIVEYLLDLGADPLSHTNIREATKTKTMFNGFLRHYRNALHAAILYSQQDCIETLLKHSPEKLVNSEGRLVNYNWLGQLVGSSWTHKFYPLHLACYTLSPEVVKQLCELGAKPDSKETSYGYTPFLCLFNSRGRNGVVGYHDLRHISSDEGKSRESRADQVVRKRQSTGEQRQIVDILIEHGANRHAQDKQDRNAVHLAACNLNIEMLQYVLTLGVSPHTIDSYGNTPLHNIHVLDRYHEELLDHWVDVVKVLVAAGVDLDARNTSGKTFLHLCAESRVYTGSLVRELIAMGADTTIVDKNELTPLFSAASTQEYEEETIQEFLRHPKSDWKHVDRHGNTLLHYAARSMNQFVQECVGLGLDVNVRNNKGATPLHMAAMNGAASTARGLIGNGADVNARDNQGNTPLHYTFKKGKYFNLIHLLCTSGADINCTNNKGEPLQPKAKEFWARNSKQPE